MQRLPTPAREEDQINTYIWGIRQQQEKLDLQQDGGGGKALEQKETPSQRRSKGWGGGASPFITADTVLEAQRHSLTPSNLATPI